MSTSGRRDHLGAAGGTGWDEDRWVVQIRKNLAQERSSDDDEDDEDKVPVCVFGVARSLMADKADAYVPHLVALGPYHQWRPELSDMQRHKLLASRRMKRKLGDHPFEDVVHRFMNLNRMIRGCYQRYLDLSNESLAWIMAVDSVFLLEFLQNMELGANNLANNLGRSPSRTSQVTDQITGINKTTQNAILRDIIMLENQIPLFLLGDLVSFIHHENPHEVFRSMLLGFCRRLSPFKLRAADFELGEDELIARVHLLELLYFVAVPKQDDTRSRGSSKTSSIAEENQGKCTAYLNPILALFKLFFFYVGKCFKLLKLKSLLKFPHRAIRVLRMFSAKRRTSAEPLPSQRNHNTLDESIKSSTSKEAPLIEELMVPKVTQLQKAGVRFSPTSGNLSTVKFDNISATLFLPATTVDENSEVVLRNLVAYEAGAVHDSLVFTRYTEFMNGIIDTEEDVKLLRREGIIQNHLKSDREVADLWNGMSRSVKLTKVAHLDKTIEDLNAYYSTKWRIRAEKAVKKYVFGCWPLLTFLAANLLIVMTTLQSFCSVYDCKGTAIGSAIAKTNSTLV
ncbi:hypothetical protein H6P81_000714 [Aristolochia fimbriata]|uniref:Uncharacterized protein n=1 Tax=Aristolochia fimbriata TaxID=158543 RepID=A0AAV7F811_ARIFI|nr:hypothetical protein H6P81_000714 [Aristolochia fimbriata]